jgi:hypothetical protein
VRAKTPKRLELDPPPERVMYWQCELDNGTERRTAWIPTALAQVGNVVDLKEFRTREQDYDKWRLDWTCGWTIVTVFSHAYGPAVYVRKNADFQQFTIERRNRLKGEG